MQNANYIVTCILEFQSITIYQCGTQQEYESFLLSHSFLKCQSTVLIFLEGGGARMVVIPKAGPR